MMRSSFASQALTSSLAKNRLLARQMQTGAIRRSRNMSLPTHVLYGSERRKEGLVRSGGKKRPRQSERKWR
jgi:hypothetical protein